MIVIHANWSEEQIHLWAEGDRPAGDPREVATNGHATPDGSPHPDVLSRSELERILRFVTSDELVEGTASLTLRLPSINGVPVPSPRRAHAVGHIAEEDGETPIGFESWVVPTLVVRGDMIGNALERLEEVGLDTESRLFDDEGTEEDALAAVHLSVADSVRFFAGAVRFTRWLLAEQRFVPALAQATSGDLYGVWQPWLSDNLTSDRVESLLHAMPPSARSVVDDSGHQAWPILEAFITSLTDQWCRRILVDDTMYDALDGWEPDEDEQVRWLGGLLNTGDRIAAHREVQAGMMRRVRLWIGGLDDRGASGEWRLCLRVNEPMMTDALEDLAAPGDDVVWRITFHLQAVDNENVLLDAEDIWTLNRDSATIDGHRVDAPQELLLGELGRASRLYKPIERALEDAAPASIDLETKHAYEFLREIRPLMIEQGFGIQAPEWWESPAARLGARLKIDSPSLDQVMAPGGGSASDAGAAQLGLNSLVSYEWQIAIGDTPLSLHEFERLASQRAPLVQINGQWIEIRPEDIRSAVDFIGNNPGGEMRVVEAMRLAWSSDQRRTGVPVLGLDATGWVGAMLGTTDEQLEMTLVEPPQGFQGSLRPYQLKGISWMVFLDRFGLGPCLADDMGLGKTIQLLGLLLHERQQSPGVKIGPTLLVVPMSIVSNWTRESARFAPALKVLVHHGVDRLSGEAFKEEAARSDIVITTYALVHRDREFIHEVDWWRVVLDEAQNIKNPTAKQSQAVRTIEAPHRVALTGTPLENRLSELWSIIDFCNPGFLGTSGEFRRNFSIPVERYHDRERSRQLRALVRPFILRRLKTDPTVISDLPEKVETREFCRLTSEQVGLYESCVRDMLGEVEKADGIRRRGVVLTTLIRLKQICNHPAQLLREETGIPDARRSGKCIRLIEMLDEVIASGEQALIFTQFRQMGHILASMLRHGLDRDVLFLHGGVTQKQREAMVDRFQAADGTAPIFVLSLKAGGVGLNLTAASHVFHFDRWWNPAVENQATDRAFRIGQTRTVHVHKFIVSGTLEDRIDQMIESKIALAEDVIGSGEDWLTELDTTQLREILSLRPEALADG